MTASITSTLDHHRHWALVVLFVLVALESFGLPLPGETALAACGVLAAHTSLAIEWVVAVAAAAAIVGDNLGYWTARTGGRRLLERWGPTRRYAERYLPRGERFFARHGGKTVFLARFVAVLRVTAAWVAGLSHMGWWRFLAWNAAGAVVWATVVGLVAFALGNAAAKMLGTAGLVVAGALVAGALVVAVIRRRRRRP